MTGLTHADAAGHVRMVDVSGKPVTRREAVARGVVQLSAGAADRLARGALPKGDGLAVARVAGIAAVKRTPDLVPLAHPIAVDGVTVDLTVGEGRVDIEVRVTSVGRTGAEMEALTGVAAAGLTVIDMVKAVDKGARITDVRVVYKAGGRRGIWVEEGTACQESVRQEEPSPLSQSLPPAAVIVVSDRRAAGLAADGTGPVLVDGLVGAGVVRVDRRTVPDDVAAIRAAVREVIDAGCRVIVTTGGTGVGPRDRTPEALAPLIDQPLPGVAEALRAGARTPLAALSRVVAGVVRGAVPALVVALPGSPGAVADGLAVLAPLLPHLIAQLDGADHPGAAHD